MIRKGSDTSQMNLTESGTIGCPEHSSNVEGRADVIQKSFNDRCTHGADWGRMWRSTWGDSTRRAGFPHFGHLFGVSVAGLSGIPETAFRVSALIYGKCVFHAVIIRRVELLFWTDCCTFELMNSWKPGSTFLA